MAKIYTKTGDSGETGLIDGIVGKDDLRVEAYGAIDEADSALGVAKVNCFNAKIVGIIELVQQQLKAVMAEVASNNGGWFVDAATEISRLENIIDELSDNLEPLTQLIIPGGKNASAYLHLARSIVRRAERISVALSRTVKLDANIVVYLNRLSDLCFVLARYEDECCC